MNVRTKKIMTITFLLSAVSASLLSLPTFAYLKGTSKGDLLQTRDRDQLGISEKDCDTLKTQTQTQERLRAYECGGYPDMPQTQERERLRIQDRECNSSTNMEQHRYQYGDRTESPRE